MPDTELGRTLLAHARRALERHFGLTDEPLADDARLAQRGATFVTLKLYDALRGCIGSLRPQRALGEDVAANAVAAATRDTRFLPVSADELNDIRIEVSLLSEPQFLEFTDEADLLRQLRPGIDGLILSGGCRSATFLPQVWNQLPEPREFVAALKRKAGLAPDHPTGNLLAATYTVRKWCE
ncbi:AmmeMemoRadiSam system protein A [Aromatoleum bremense]|uniref:AmmeMemoRadiSam system protein A n=1 Tax=Aromatoleum bremense TaxID=76115 RepID=A0ABX1NQS3_9RHOO|nr:AmmeMemoRadiSam system protein A [Aromatoleum bremense]